MASSEKQIKPVVVSASSAGSTSAVLPRPRMEFRNWPLVSRTWFSLAVAAVNLSVGFVVVVTTSQWAMAGLLLAILFLLSWRLWIPTYVQLGPTGLRQSILGIRKKHSWSEVTEVKFHPRGVQLFFSDPLDGAVRSRSMLLENTVRLEELQHTVSFYCE